MARRALITGIGGQDGSYLAELLLEKGYEVHGLVRRPEEIDERLTPVRARLTLHAGDLLDAPSLAAADAAAEPDEVYNLATISHVGASWEAALESADAGALGVTRMLEAVRAERPEARFFQASSSEIFPASGGVPQDESTPIGPRAPYGVAKAYGHLITGVYRERHGLFATSGILFNHESPRRGLSFVTRKITHAAAAIKLGLADELGLGNLTARRDWGYAPEYVEAMWLMLQRDEPEDFVLGTGEHHSIREFVDAAFAEVGIDPDAYVDRDPASVRWGDEAFALAEPSKARELLGWEARTRFHGLVRLMVAADLAALDQSSSDPDSDGRAG